MAILPFQNSSNFQVSSLAFVAGNQNGFITVSEPTMTYAFKTVITCVAMAVIGCTACVYIKAKVRPERPLPSISENLSFHVTEYKEKTKPTLDTRKAASTCKQQTVQTKAKKWVWEDIKTWDDVKKVDLFDLRNDMLRKTNIFFRDNMYTISGFLFCLNLGRG